MTKSSLHARRLLFMIVIPSFMIILISLLYPSTFFDDPYLQAPNGKEFLLQGKKFKFIHDTPDFHDRHFSIYDPTPSSSPIENLDHILQKDHIYADVLLNGYRVLACAENEERTGNHVDPSQSFYTDLSILYDATMVTLHHGDCEIQQGERIMLYVPYYHSDSLDSLYEIGKVYRFDLRKSSQAFGNGSSAKPWSRYSLSLPCLLLSDYAISFQRYRLNSNSPSLDYDVYLP